jgi:hypothetical protein
MADDAMMGRWWVHCVDHPDAIAFVGNREVA